MDVNTRRWSSERKQDQFVVTDPSTGERIALIQGCGPAEVDQAVRAAHRAFQDDWRWRPGRERGAMLQEVARRLRDCAEEIASLETRENGKPLPQARLDVAACIDTFDYFGGLAGKLPGDFFDAGPICGITVLEPYGVVGAILPFNWPPIHTAGKTAPALAAGNTIVVKPPEQTPLTVMRILEIVQDVVPPNVVQVVPGHGSEAGAALAGHKLVRRISFTGSTKVGAAVVKQAADNVTPTLLELGGKNAVIVLEDADLDLAVRGVFEAGFYNQGEACTAGSRVLVHRDLYQPLVERLTAAVLRLRVGAGTAPGTHVGPLITGKQQQRVLEYIEIGLAEGATMAAQALLPTDPALAGGFFVPPTLFSDVKRKMRIAQEEIFGPVVSILPINSADEAVSIANENEYGLVGAIFTRNQETALRIARQLDVGMVYLNNYYRRSSGMPFGGVKASGYGREHSIETLKEFGWTKLIRMPSGLGKIPVWPAVTDVGL